MADQLKTETLLSAVTGTGAGPAVGLLQPYRIFTVNKRIVGGTVSALVVNYEGSIDGTNWFQLDTDNATANGAKFIVDKPVLWIRANVATFTGSGGTPAVTVECFASK